MKLGDVTSHSENKTKLSALISEKTNISKLSAASCSVKLLNAFDIWVIPHQITHFLRFNLTDFILLSRFVWLYEKTPKLKLEHFWSCG